MGQKLRLRLRARSRRPAPTLTAIPKIRLWAKGPRSLDQLLKQAEKATQVRRARTAQVLAELKLLRESTHDAELKSALAWLCNALTRLVNNPSAAHSREVLMAADAVRRVAG